MNTIDVCQKNLTESINERVDFCVFRLDSTDDRQGGNICGTSGVVATKIGGDTHAGVDFKPISKPDKCAA